MTLSEDDRRELAVWAADCAERTLALFEAQAPSDTRPRAAIDGVRAFARGELRIGGARALSAQAHAAARAVSDPAAVAAARAAGHAAAVAHMAAHARGAAAYAAVARRMVAPDDPAAVADEVRWAVSRASPIVREVLRRSPPATRPACLLGAAISDMHTQLGSGNDSCIFDPFERVLGDEIGRRANRGLASRIAEARFKDADKAFENFDSDPRSGR